MSQKYCRILRQTAINEGNKVDINVIKFFFHLFQSSWIVPQLKTVVGLYIFSMVLKELQFLQLRPTNIKTIKDMYI